MVLKPRYEATDLSSVLDPYKLTWFSNYPDEIVFSGIVLDPYKLTWFSNLTKTVRSTIKVLDPYKLTWFSNLYFAILCNRQF